MQKISQCMAAYLIKNMSIHRSDGQLLALDWKLLDEFLREMCNFLLDVWASMKGHYVSERLVLKSAHLGARQVEAQAKTHLVSQAKRDRIGASRHAPPRQCARRTA